MADPIKRTEYRVVGDRKGFNFTPNVSVGGPFPAFPEARDYLRDFNLIGFDCVYSNLCIQKNEITESGWIDVEAEEADRG